MDSHTNLFNLVRMMDGLLRVTGNGVLFDFLICLLWVYIFDDGAETLTKLIMGNIHIVGILNIFL